MQIIETNRHSGGESLISCLAVRFRPVEDVKELIRSSAGVPVSGLDALSSAAYGPSSCADNYDSAGPRWNLILIIRGSRGFPGQTTQAVALGHVTHVHGNAVRHSLIIELTQTSPL